MVNFPTQRLLRPQTMTFPDVEIRVASSALLEKNAGRDSSSRTNTSTSSSRRRYVRQKRKSFEFAVTRRRMNRTPKFIIKDAFAPKKRAGLFVFFLVF